MKRSDSRFSVHMRYLVDVLGEVVDELKTTGIGRDQSLSRCRRKAPFACYVEVIEETVSLLSLVEEYGSVLS